ncbi:MAG: ATP-dependent Clp endopeptidase proteolytic subunit ClpP [Candidatus Caenarcaniphilales bacterium]|jgi:ATP-dependent Clp protease protease subunit|nr:ATP-dependent Clp endopeptidase proteolytic subunit ClpP [Candidatus Caenarcaniphilales bacterium]
MDIIISKVKPQVRADIASITNNYGIPNPLDLQGQTIVSPKAYVPSVIENTPRGERSFDLFSRLLRERIIFLTSEVEDIVSSIIVGQLLLLDSEDASKDIYFYINSPGGSVTAGLAMYDTMQHVRANVVTICLGQCASMGAFLLSSGEKGKRMALPHSRILIHQPLGGAQGQASDIEIQAKEILRMKKMLNEILAKNCNQPYEKLEKDTDRDNIMTPEQAKEYGLIDLVVVKRPNEVETES